LGAQKDSSIIYGHNAKNKDELINFVKNNAWDQLLCKVNAKPNDLFYVPSGTLHALGRGLVIYEIQQASDVTYRLFDYRRNREMNVQEALDNINVPFITPHFQSDGNTLVDSKEFSLARIQNRGAHHYRFPLAR
jgi:mannose-6-phosphate isomerase